MRNIVFVCLLLCSSTIWAQDNKEVMSKHGYRMIMRHQAGNPKAKFGEEMLVNVKVYIGDSLLQNSQNFAPTGFKAPLPSQEEFENSPSMPVLVDAGLAMGAGDSLTAFMKVDSFIRSSFAPALQKYNEIRYEIKMLKVITAEEQRLEVERAQQHFKEVEKEVATIGAAYRSNTLSTQGTASGLKYHVTDQGKGEAIQKGENVAVHYYGCLKDGTPFDNSFERGEALKFGAGVGQMIPGFDEGVLLLNHGAKAYLFIPSTLGYGEQGAGAVIPPNAELIFYIEIQ